MARTIDRVGWGIRMELGEVAPDGRSVTTRVRLSRWRLAWELLKVLASIRVRVAR